GIRDGHVTGVQTCALPIYEALLKLHRFVVVAGSATDGLQRHQAADQRVLREVDHAHRSLAELADDLVTAELHRSLSALVRARFRSEEHTSELQSRGHLVCR